MNRTALVFTLPHGFHPVATGCFPGKRGASTPSTDLQRIDQNSRDRDPLSEKIGLGPHVEQGG